MKRLTPAGVTSMTFLVVMLLVTAYFGKMFLAAAPITPRGRFASNRVIVAPAPPDPQPTAVSPQVQWTASGVNLPEVATNDGRSWDDAAPSDKEQIETPAPSSPPRAIEPPVPTPAPVSAPTPAAVVVTAPAPAPRPTNPPPFIAEYYRAGTRTVLQFPAQPGAASSGGNVDTP